MKIIKGFEGEDLEVSDFGEWVGKDYIDYKFEYINNRKIMKELFKENQELKKQLEDVDYTSVYIKGCKDTKNKYETQQKEFIEYLEKEIVDSRAGSGQQYYAQQHLKLYKEIKGGKNGN